ncbi:zinc ribbon domain-containing protein [Paenibacillus sp. 79R4]|uniref:zinc ribbon domain-containing protein n=1 Tax=Paenibacillus sp. 79R4 TaxID=2212847 RepID=UPI0015B901E5|nr:zinc ribbon domain-containing protein [Paenibacillus sp. 79R4]NWL90398.1 zinc ribbon domain-containing protein [Paenibacillus sp. 79R4]
MNFFRKIKDSAGKMSDRAQNVVEIGRLNTQISNIEREMGLYYQKMGEVFYEGYRIKDMSEAEKEMLELAKTCDLLVEERDEIRLKIAELKNERLCGACSKSIAQDALFCPYCGSKLEKSSGQIADRNPGGLKDLQAEESAVSDETMVYKPQILEDLPLKSVLEQDEDSDELDERRKQQLERERERQEELDRRIRTWKENVGKPDDSNSYADKSYRDLPNPDRSASVEIDARKSESDPEGQTVKCQICSSVLVKGTKWCPHCGSEQL